MTPGNADRPAATFLPARVNDAAGLAELGADMAKVLRFAVSSGLALERMVLVRWDGIQDFAGQRRSKVGQNLAAVLREEIEKSLPGPGICVRYDDLSLLVVVDDGAPAATDDFENALRQGIQTRLPGIGGDDGPIRLWQPVAVSDGGFDFEPVPTPAAAAAPVEEAPARQPRVVLADPVYRYCPLWDASANQVFCYLCEPRWPIGDGEPQPEESLPEILGDPRRITIVDMETLHRAVDQVETVVDRLAFMNVLIPVHFRTLAAPDSAEQYLEGCNGRIWPVHDYVYFEIVQPPASVSGEDLARVIETIQPFGSGVMLRLPSGFDGFDRVPAGNLLSVGLNLPPDPRPDPEILTELRAFAAETDGLGLSRHVHSLQSTPLAMGAAYAGFEFVGSGAVASLEDGEPDPGGAPFDMFSPIAALKKARS